MTHAPDNLNILRTLNRSAQMLIQNIKSGFNYNHTLERVEALQAQIEDRTNYKTMLGYRRLRGLKFTARAASAIARRAKELSLEQDLPIRYDNSDSKPEYHIDILDAAYNEALENQILLTVKASPGGLTHVYTTSEQPPVLPSAVKKQGNTYNGVAITSIRICNEVPDFLLGYNALEGTNHSKYNIWQNVLHPKIEELTGLKIKDLKKYGVSTMKPLENQGKLGILYAWMHPYIKHAATIKPQAHHKPVADGKLRLEKIKAAERRRKSSS